LPVDLLIHKIYSHYSALKQSIK